MMNHTELKEQYDLPALIESMLFVAVSSTTISQMAAALNVGERAIENALDQLGKYYQESRCLMIQKKGNKFQLVTKPDISKVLEDFLGIEVETKLTRASLETLAIIAYRQPISRPMIEDIRGVNSDGVVRNLLSKGLIEEVGRFDGPGRAILYGTSSDFLNYFGLQSIEELPAFDTLPIDDQGDKKILKE